MHGVLVAISGIATGIAACVLTREALARYLFKIPSIWQDDVTIFLLVGATFLSAAWVQARRGHVGIQALSAILPPRIDRIRLFIADFLTLLFVAFYAWKSWELLLEAIDEERVTYSAWGAPVWIPFTCMSVGMSLVALQLFLQMCGIKSRWYKA